MPNFEVFTKRTSPRIKDPSVTIQKKGTMSINRASYEALGAPEAIELLFDEKERIMGMRAVDASSEHAYPLRGSGKKHSSFLLSGMAFTKFYELDTSVARRYRAHFREGILQVDLNGESTEVISNRTKSELRKQQSQQAGQVVETPETLEGL